MPSVKLLRRQPNLWTAEIFFFFFYRQSHFPPEIGRWCYRWVPRLLQTHKPLIALAFVHGRWLMCHLIGNSEITLPNPLQLLQPKMFQPKVAWPRLLQLISQGHFLWPPFLLHQLSITTDTYVILTWRLDECLPDVKSGAQQPCSYRPMFWHDQTAPISDRNPNFLLWLCKHMSNAMNNFQQPIMSINQNESVTQQPIKTQSTVKSQCRSGRNQRLWRKLKVLI